MIFMGTMLVFKQNGISDSTWNSKNSHKEMLDGISFKDSYLEFP